MNRTIQRLLKPLTNRWVLLILAGALGLQLGTAPVFAQDGGSSLSRQEKKQLRKRLKKTYKEGAMAGNNENYEVAAAKFKESLQLAQKLGLNNLTGKIQNNLFQSLKQAGTADLKKENYEEALTHFEEAMKYSDNDPSIYYNRGLALVNIDSTEAGLQSLQKAIQIGNKTGNTRVAGLATERIRDEFLAKASKALQGDNPSQAQINTALEALDKMREYVEPNADAMFYRATALLEGGQYQKAIQAARKGLDMHQGSRSDAAKFYFVIAEAQKQLGNKSAACKTYENAAYGDYKARAEHYLKNECQ